MRIATITGMPMSACSNSRAVRPISMFAAHSSPSSKAPRHHGPPPFAIAPAPTAVVSRPAIPRLPGLGASSTMNSTAARAFHSKRSRARATNFANSFAASPSASLTSALGPLRPAALPPASVKLWSDGWIPFAASAKVTASAWLSSALKLPEKCPNAAAPFPSG